MKEKQPKKNNKEKPIKKYKCKDCKKEINTVYDGMCQDCNLK